MRVAALQQVLLEHQLLGVRVEVEGVGAVRQDGRVDGHDAGPGHHLVVGHLAQAVHELKAAHGGLLGGQRHVQHVVERVGVGVAVVVLVADGADGQDLRMGGEGEGTGQQEQEDRGTHGLGFGSWTCDAHAKGPACPAKINKS